MTGPKWPVAEFGARITTLGAAASTVLLLFGEQDDEAFADAEPKGHSISP